MAKKQRVRKVNGTIIINGVPSKKTVKKILKLATDTDKVPEYGSGAITYEIDVMSILGY